MDGQHELDNALKIEHRFRGSKVRTVLELEDGPVDQVTALGVSVPNVVMGRADPTSTDPSSTCASNDNSGTCLKNVTNSTFTLPIALGIAIPVVGVLIAFFFLHRRHVRKMRIEDANDPHKSLDFGLGDVPRNRKKVGSEMAISELGLREKSSRMRQQKSMDLDMVSPYLLPPELQNSRESLHSLSRTIHQHEDPYRPVSQFVANDTHNRPRGDSSSIYTVSSNAPSRFHETSSADLLSNAAEMPKSLPAAFVPPPRQKSLPKSTASKSHSNSLDNSLPQSAARSKPPHLVDQPEIQVSPPTLLNTQRKGVPGGLPSSLRPGQGRGLSAGLPAGDGTESWMGNGVDVVRNSNNYLGATISVDETSPSIIAPPPPAKSPERQFIQESEMAPQITRQSPPVSNSLPTNPRPVRQQSLPLNQPPQLPPLPQPQEAWIDDGSDYGDDSQITPPSPGRENIRDQRYSMDVPREEFAQAGLSAPSFDPRRVSVGFRPLPPENTINSDDPEIRANRIRSFYKEYFDESKLAPQGQYYEDYDPNYLNDMAYFDPDENKFVMPYAQPVTRRAMTPPPQSQRFMGHPPRAFHGSMGGYDGRGMMPPGHRAYSSTSGPMGPPGHRAYSSASGPMGPPGPRRKPMPPTPLNTLPTPSKLRDDSFAIFNSIDFAPPVSYKERQTGRSQSPLGERRPYSPAVSAYKPLVSTYDELPSMPSPHLLRKSGTYTALDFAPPRRIKAPDTMSDSGSIRSNRSGVSTRTQQAIRAGAYRVSRLPGDMVFSKDEIGLALKPSWKVGS